MWDTGPVPDSSFKPGGGPAMLRYATSTKPLTTRLAEVGYAPADITYLALSHYHGDHVANASQFAKSTWIVQKADRDAILGPRPAGTRVPDPKFFEGLADAKAIVLNGEGRECAIIETTALTERRFDEIDADWAMAEGEGDRTLDSWRAGHEAFFTREGVFRDTMPLWCERFRLVEIVSRRARP